MRIIKECGGMWKFLGYTPEEMIAHFGAQLVAMGKTWADYG